MTDATVELIHSDNWGALVELSRTHAGKAALVYMDPPFNTGKKQTGGMGFGGLEKLMYDDPLYDVDSFAGDLAARARLAWGLVAPTGSLVVHLDWRTVHYAKCQLDHVCGADHFVSEIIWRYRRWSTKTRNFQRVHDTLLRYVKDPKLATWNQLYEPLAPSTVATWGDRKQCAVFSSGEGGSSKRTKSSKTDEPSPGVPMGDVWDISIIAPTSKERTGWPTQKPEALLERLILATTNPGDLVVEPYLGSGTACAVAKRLGRNAIGIDENHQAISVARKRLEMEE